MAENMGVVVGGLTDEWTFQSVKDLYENRMFDEPDHLFEFVDRTLPAGEQHAQWGALAAAMPDSLPETTKLRAAIADGDVGEAFVLYLGALHRFLCRHDASYRHSSG
jgi:hypothetical protein